MNENIAHSFRPRLIWTRALLALVVLFVGCGQELESTHEHSHEEPRHWPRDMAQAAASIGGRMKTLENPNISADTRARIIDELKDLVEWSPEIAGDTDLPESNWLPIYEISEQIRSHMQAGDVDPLVFESDFAKLTELLDKASKQMTSLRASELARMGTVLTDEEESADDAEPPAAEEAIPEQDSASE